METVYTIYQTGRRFLIRLPAGEDLIRSIEQFCRDAAVPSAAFSVTGAVSSYAVGTFDQQQQVYVTAADTAPRELAACSGTVTLQDGNPAAVAHAVLADDRGRLTGGRLFPGTRVFACELVLQELTGDPMERHYDMETGQMLWRKSPDRTT